MATKKRITVVGAIAHVMARGIDGIPLFKIDEDRHYFRNQLSEYLNKTGYLCYGWTVMDTHYHLVLRCSDRPLDELMRSLNSRYARYYNKKYHRRGYLFQDRYKSIISQDQGYLEELIRYVHLNPVRAGICKGLEELDNYPWCGHGVFMGKCSMSFQNTETVLKRFGSNTVSARLNYKKFMEEGLKTVTDGWIVDKVRESNRGVNKKDEPGCWVIGDRDFIVSVINKNKERLRLNHIKHKYSSVEEVLEIIAEENKLTSEEIKGRSRLGKVSECRKKFVYLCCRVLGFSVDEVSRFLNVSGPAISWTLSKAEGVMTKKEISKFINLPPG